MLSTARCREVLRMTRSWLVRSRIGMDPERLSYLSTPAASGLRYSDMDPYKRAAYF